MSHQRKQWNIDPDSQPPIIAVEDSEHGANFTSDVAPSHAEYLLQLQARNRVLRQLHTQSDQERQRMCREYGFSVYVNGANAGKQQEKPSIKHSKRKAEALFEQPLREAGKNGYQGWLSQPEPTRAKTPAEKLQKQRKNWQVESIDVKTTLGQSIRIKAPAHDAGKYDDDFEDDENNGSSEEEVEEDFKDTKFKYKKHIDSDSTDEVSTEDDSEFINNSSSSDTDRSVNKNYGRSSHPSDSCDTKKIKYLNSPAPRKITNTSGLQLARIKSRDMERITVSVKDIHQLRQSIQSNAEIRASLATPLQTVQINSVINSSQNIEVDQSRNSFVYDKDTNQSRRSIDYENSAMKQTSNTRLSSDDTVVIEFPAAYSVGNSYLSISNNFLMDAVKPNASYIVSVSQKTDESETSNLISKFVLDSRSNNDLHCDSKILDTLKKDADSSVHNMEVSATGVEHIIKKVLQLKPKGQQHLLKVLAEIEHNANTVVKSLSELENKDVSLDSQGLHIGNTETDAGTSITGNQNNKNRKNASETLYATGSFPFMKRDNNNNSKNSYDMKRNVRINKCSDVADSKDSAAANGANNSSSVQSSSSNHQINSMSDNKRKSQHRSSEKSDVNLLKHQTNQDSKSDSKITITIDLMTNWGHPSRIGLTEIQLFDKSGNKIQVQDIGSKYANTERGTVSALINGKVRTTKERHMWSSALPDRNSESVRVAMSVKGCSFSKMKVWNYNQSVGDVNIGAKRIRVKVQGQGLVFDGELNRAVGNEVFDYGMTIPLNKQMKFDASVQVFGCSDHQACEQQSNTVNQNPEIEWMQDSQNSPVTQVGSKGSQTRKSTSTGVVGSNSGTTSSISKTADRKSRSVQDSEAIHSSKSTSNNDLFNIHDGTVESVKVRTITDKTVNELGFFVDGIQLGDEAGSRDGFGLPMVNKSYSISAVQQSDDDSVPIFLQIQQLAKERKRQLATPENEMEEEIGNKLEKNRVKSENFDPDWLEERPNTDNLANITSDKAFKASNGQTKDILNRDKDDLDDIFNLSRGRTDKSSKNRKSHDDKLDTHEEKEEDILSDGWLDAPDIEKLEKSASSKKDEKILAKDLLMYDIVSDPANEDVETLVRSVTPMQQIEKSVQQRRRNLEESWTSLDLFNKLQKGRLSVDLERETMNEYLMAHAASASLTSSLYEQTNFGRRRLLSGTTLGQVGEEGEGEVDLSEFEIPELPYGRELVINIRSTWGDRHYVGLNGIEVFTDNGCSARVRSITADPSNINILPDYNDDPRVVDNLLDGVNRTTDDTHMWLAPFTSGKDHKIIIRLESSSRLAVLRVWNYNKSRVHSTRGARHVEITFDGVPIFVGEIARASGTLLRDSYESYGDTILFTTDENILELVSRNDSTFELDYTANQNNDDIDDDTSKRPATADKNVDDDARPYTSAAYVPPTNDTNIDQILSESSTSLPTQRPPEMPIIDLDTHRSPQKSAITCPAGRYLKLNFTSTWGDPHYLGLTGLEVINELGQTIPISRDQLTADPPDLRILPGYEDDDRTLDKLVDGVNLTMDDCHMWLIPFTSGERHEVNIDLHRMCSVLGLRVWNYNKSIEDTYRGARTVQIHLDGKQLTPPNAEHSSTDEFLIRKGPGNSFFDFAQHIHFVQLAPVIRSGSKRISVSTDVSKSGGLIPSGDGEIEEYEWTLMPRGFIYQLQLLSSWGDHYYIGLNGLELYDSKGHLVHLNPSNITAFPESVNALKKARVSGSAINESETLIRTLSQSGLGGAEVEDVRTPDKLIDGINETCDGRHMWLAPILPGIVNRIYILFDEPMEISAIKIWNYSKTSCRGVKDFALLVDDLLVYSGTMKMIEDSNSKGQGCHTVRFTRCPEGKVRSSGMQSISEDLEEQEIRLMNDHQEIDNMRDKSARDRMMTHHVLQKSVDQSLRPSTCVPRRGGKTF